MHLQHPGGGAIHEEEGACQIGLDTIGSAPVWSAIRLDRTHPGRKPQPVEWQTAHDAGEILFEVTPIHGSWEKVSELGLEGNDGWGKGVFMKRTNEVEQRLWYPKEVLQVG